MAPGISKIETPQDGMIRCSQGSRRGSHATPVGSHGPRFGKSSSAKRSLRPRPRSHVSALRSHGSRFRSQGMRCLASCPISKAPHQDSLWRNPSRRVGRKPSGERIATSSPHADYAARDDPGVGPAQARGIDPRQGIRVTQPVPAVCVAGVPPATVPGETPETLTGGTPVLRQPRPPAAGIPQADSSRSDPDRQTTGPRRRPPVPAPPNSSFSFLIIVLEPALIEYVTVKTI